MQSAENFKPNDFVTIVRILEHQPETISENFITQINPTPELSGKPYLVLEVQSPFLLVHSLEEPENPLEEIVSPIDLRKYGVTKLKESYVDYFLNGNVIATPLGLIGKEKSEFYKDTSILDFDFDQYACPVCGNRMNERRKTEGMFLLCKSCTFEGKLP